MKFFKYIINLIKKIKLVDKFLIIFMTILLGQSIYNVFAVEIVSNEAMPIDVIFRTSSASIFGYFLSSNFIKNEKPAKTPKENTTCRFTVLQNSCPQPEIFVEPEQEIEENANMTTDVSTANSLQIMIAGIIGLVALFFLMHVRNFITITEDSIATISQMRDFFSGSIGFLLGIETYDIDKS